MRKKNHLPGIEFDFVLFRMLVLPSTFDSILADEENFGGGGGIILGGAGGTPLSAG